MTEREKVIKELKKIIADEWMFRHADYYQQICKDALTMLKAQEPVKPKVDVDVWVCGNCGTSLERQSLAGPNVLIAEQFNYCPQCGRAVKWVD